MAEDPTPQVRTDLTDAQRRKLVAQMAGRKVDLEEMEKTTNLSGEDLTAALLAAQQADDAVMFTPEAAAQEQAGLVTDARQRGADYQSALTDIYGRAIGGDTGTWNNFADRWDTVITATNKSLLDYAAELEEARSRGRGGGGGGWGGGGLPGFEWPGSDYGLYSETPGMRSDRNLPYHEGAGLFSRGAAPVVFDPSGITSNEYYEDYNDMANAMNVAFQDAYYDGDSLGAARTRAAMVAARYTTNGGVIESLLEEMTRAWAEQWTVAERIAAQAPPMPGGDPGTTQGPQPGGYPPGPGVNVPPPPAPPPQPKGGAGSVQF